MNFVQINDKNLKVWQPQLEKFEKHFTYPLGEDSFTIEHGDDYLSFFRRMGAVRLIGAELNGEIVAVGCGVIHKRAKAWYLCDVKVHKDYRGQKIPVRFFKKLFLPCYLMNQRGFALTMESDNGKQNPIIKIMETLPFTPLRKGTVLHFYYEPAAATELAVGILQKERQKISFSSLRGIKDLVLKSTGAPLPLLHMEWGEEIEGATNIRDGFLHMWCLPEGSPLIEELKQFNILPKARGSIFHHRLKKFDWSNLRTSEL